MKEELSVLAAAFIEHFAQPVVLDGEMVFEKRDNSSTQWAIDRVFDITYEEPEALWPFILEALKQGPSDEALSVLAAGPLEDYLAKCGDSAIEQVEAQAAKDPAFKDLLGGVWKNDMSEDVWRRVEACRGHPW